VDGDTFGADARFLALERLGAGAAGEVFRVIDRRFRHEVALKTLFRADPAAILRFKNEFRSLADVVHPNLAQLYELQKDGQAWFFTMEMVPGVDLYEWVRGAKVAGEGEPPSPPPDEPRLREALLQLVQGLCALHAAGKLHCDLKPSNLRVTPAGRVVLLDFGLVREIAPRSDQTFELAGTPAYMSPEQLGGLAITPASDFYAVGVLLFELLTGRRPHVGSFAQILHAKLSGVAPSPLSLVDSLPTDLAALCESLLRQDPEARPSGGELLEQLGARLPAMRQEAEPRFIGRERHLEVLEAALCRCLAGRAAVVWVHGSSGMGKSALVSHFVARASERRPDLLCLQGRCYERESVPYKALDALLDALARHLRHLAEGETASLLPPDILALARLFPALHSVEEIASAQRAVLDMPDEREQRRRAHLALRELLRRLARRQPLVLIIDDLQWGDRDSAGLLAELLRPPEAPPFLLLGCFRSEERESSPLLQALLDSAGQLEAGASRELEVAELDPDAAAALARHLLAERGRPRSEDSGIGATEVEAADALLARSIARESQGSPFFVGELVEHAVSDLDGSADTLPKFEDDSTSATLDRLIVARLRRLPPETRRLLEVVAVAGRPLELEVALEVAALGFEGPAAVANLRASNLIRIRRLRSHDAIEPYHDRIREAVARRVERLERPRLHRLLAERLERSESAEPETIASHWREAGEPQKESYWVAEAAAGAARALAFDRAAGLYARALDLEPAGSSERHRLQLSLGQALADAGRGPEAAAAFLAACSAAAPAEGLELRRRAAEQQLISGHIDDGIATARGVLASIGMEMPRSIGHTLFGLIGKRLRLKLRGLRFRERPAAEVPPELLLRIDTCRSISMGLANVQPMLGMSFATSHLLHALEAGEPHRLSLALALEAAYSAAAGSKSHGRTAKLVEAAGMLADKVASPQAQGMALFAAGISHYFEGRPDRSLDFLLRADTVLRERCTGVSWERDTVLFYSLRVLRMLGKVAQLRGLVPATLKDVMERGDLYAETCLRSAGLWLCELSEDRPQAALQEIETARGKWSQEGFHPLHYVQLGARIDIANYQGDGDRAWAAIETGWPRLERSQMLRFQLVAVDANLLRARAACAAAALAGNSEAARRKLLAAAAAALGKAEKQRALWARPFCQQARAVMAAFGGEKEAAAELLTLAAAGFDAGSFELPAALCRRRHGQLAGGAKGEAEIHKADAWMKEQGIADPERFAAAFLPGPW
jgi:tRNA A-37 threonylcarbamoyl transferase component Bud32